MSTIVRDSIGSYGQITIPVVGQTVEDLFQNLLAIKRENCPDWTDESPADFGVQILRLSATLHHWLQTDLDRMKDNCYLSTARDRESARRICEPLGYALSEGAPASVSVTVTCEAGHAGISIPKGTRVSTVDTDDEAALVFEVADDEYVGAGITSYEVACIEGLSITDEIVGSSSGRAWTSFTLSRRPAVWQSEVVRVKEGNTWVTWSRVDNFIDSTSTDRHYTISQDSSSRYSITFGNGINGKICPRGDRNVSVSYRQGGGVDGNVAAGAITRVIDTISGVVSVTNDLPASGGADQETLEHVKMSAALLHRSLGRIVTIGDAETLAESFVSPTHGGVAKARGFEAGGNAISVMIVPKTGKTPSAGLKAALLDYLTTRRIAGMALQVVSPNYLSVNVAADVYILKNYPESVVAHAIRNGLVSLLSPAYQDPSTGLYPHEFGRDIYLSDIYGLIEGIEGVDHVTITAPTGDVVVPDFQMVDIGDIDLTIHSPQSDEFAYYTTRDEIPKQVAFAARSFKE